MTRYAATALVITVVSLFSTAGTTANAAHNYEAATVASVSVTTFSSSGSAGDTVSAPL